MLQNTSAINFEIYESKISAVTAPLWIHLKQTEIGD